MHARTHARLLAHDIISSRGVLSRRLATGTAQHALTTRWPSIGGRINSFSPY